MKYFGVLIGALLLSGCVDLMLAKDLPDSDFVEPSVEPYITPTPTLSPTPVPHIQFDAN